MNSTAALLPNILFLLAAAVFVVILFKKLNLSPVLGYFAAGATISKYGLGLISVHEIEAFAEFGVIFLLFAIGLELTFDRLKAMRRHVFGFGSLQLIITSLVLGFIASKFKVGLNAAMIIGGGFALSSTAIVLQVITENRRQSTQVGRLSLAVLLMQDFAVVPLLVMVPILAGENNSGIAHAMGYAFLNAITALLVIFLAGRLLLRPLFGMITSASSAKSDELFVATTLLVALGAAWFTDQQGLSLALGAFVAGLLVAETEFQIQAEESISPFKGLFLGLFFMTVGMSINPHIILERLGPILLISISLILIKAIIITALCIAFRFSMGAAIHAGLLLAQGSEFAFILFGLATEKNIISQTVGQNLLLVVTITMALTPLLSSIGEWLANKIDKKDRTSPSKIYKEIADLENHVVIIGFGRVGKMVARLLEAENIHYTAMDINFDSVNESRREGFPVYPGDASRLDMLKSLGIDRARSVVISVENEVTLKKTAKIIRTNFPNLPIIVRAKDLSQDQDLYEIGATTIVPETYETGLQLGGAVLKSVGISELEVSRIKNRFRLGNYVMAKEPDEQEEIAEESYEYLPEAKEKTPEAEAVS